MGDQFRTILETSISKTRPVVNSQPKKADTSNNEIDTAGNEPDDDNNDDDDDNGNDDEFSRYKINKMLTEAEEMLTKAKKAKSTVNLLFNKKEWLELKKKKPNKFKMIKGYLKQKAKELDNA